MTSAYTIATAATLTRKKFVYTAANAYGSSPRRPVRIATGTATIPNSTTAIDTRIASCASSPVTSRTP